MLPPVSLPRETAAKPASNGKPVEEKSVAGSQETVVKKVDTKKESKKEEKKVEFVMDVKATPVAAAIMLLPLPVP